MGSGGEIFIKKIDKDESGERAAMLVKAVSEVEDFFLYEKEGELYDFLINAVERPLIENLLRKTEGNQFKVARILGINRNTLHAKIKKLGIDAGYFKYINTKRERRLR